VTPLLLAHFNWSPSVFSGEHSQRPQGYTLDDDDDDDDLLPLTVSQ